MNILLTIKAKDQQTFFTRTRQYLLAFFVIATAAWLCYELAQTLGYYIVSFILLILVSILATFLKTGPVLFASLLSLMIWNFFFIPPYHTLHIEKTEDILMFGMFGLVVIMNGVFTTRVRRQEKLTREREVHTNALFQLTRELSKTSGLDEVIAVSTREIKNHFDLESFIIPKGDAVELLESEFSHYPLQGTLINPGVVVLEQADNFSEDKRVFWDTFLAQISNALEREFLAELARKARFLDESDRFYKTLFNSVSHELRIPVAAILAASDAMLETSNPGGIHTALSKEIYTATLRLNRLIENLLNMSRLESGRIALRLDWYDLNDLVYKVISDLEEDLKAFTIKVSVPENIPLVRIDFGLMEQILYNLIFNSCQYATATSEIAVSAEHVDGNLVIKVLDRGPGFPPAALENVFNKFFRVNEKGTGGLGLGLSIVKGFAEAHKGHVIAENRPGGGAAVTVSIPSDVPDINDISMDKSDA